MLRMSRELDILWIGAILLPYMSRKEYAGRHSSEPVEPIPLPPDLAAFFATQPVACVMHETNEGTAHVIKLPYQEIASVRGRVPIQVRHELYAHPRAPVIRTVLTIYDQPDRPLAIETMTNVAEADQRDDFARLATQDELLLLFYDEQLRHRLSKQVGNVDPDTIKEIIKQAEAVQRRISPERYDFMAAKEAVLRRTKL
jgi:hypothetical protein